MTSNAVGRAGGDAGTRREPSRRYRRDIDWRSIEQDYRSGSFSLRELAQKHGCSHSAIANFAGRHGWTRKPCPCAQIEAHDGHHE
jgi:hypothetical protein